MYNKIMDLKDKKVAVIGYGISGKAAVDFLISEGANVILYNQEEIEVDGVKLRIDNILEEGVELLVSSPGVPQDHVLLVQAKENNIKVRNDITLFLDVWDYRGKVIGVTGSNGKSTTVSLLHEALNKLGVKNYLGGNIGIPPLTFYQDLNEGDIVILELSSYQLESFNESHYVDLATITNITENHLDRYGGSWEKYVDAKLNIVKDGHTKIFVEGENEGINKYVLQKVTNNEVTKIFYDEVKDLSLSLIGEHNKLNAGIVIAVLKYLGFDKADSIGAIKGFRGLEHRIEKITEIDGVTFINDSKSTSPDAVLKALDAVTDKKNVILIIGGAHKGASFDVVKDKLEEVVKKVVVLPGPAKDILTEINNSICVDNLDEALIEAVKSSEEGDIVLLSPGASSKGYYKSFEDRGNQFKNKVLNLKNDR
jgi:UDP-N-acetylmuramoylalanine--D-glutamate ligase